MTTKRHLNSARISIVIGILALPILHGYLYCTVLVLYTGGAYNVPDLTTDLLYPTLAERPWFTVPNLGRVAHNLSGQ